MKLQLDKELDALKKTDALHRSGAVEQVKLLMQADEAVDREILRNIGLDSNFARMEAAHGFQLELENLEEKYEGGIFTEGQIYTLALKYKLRFLPSRLFKGNVDVQVAAKVKEFAKVAIANVTDKHSLQNNFFILAPAEAFQLQEVKYVKKPKDPDPILFYKTIEGQYKLIHKWGKDFTIFRRIVGWKWENLVNYLTFNYICVAAVVVPLIAYLLPVWYAYAPFWMTIGSLIIACGVTLILFRSKVRRDEDPDDKEKRQFFTKYNWNSPKKLY